MTFIIHNTLPNKVVVSVNFVSSRIVSSVLDKLVWNINTRFRSYSFDNFFVILLVNALEYYIILYEVHILGSFVLLF